SRDGITRAETPPTRTNPMKLPRNAQIWLPGYIRNRVTTGFRKPPRRVWLAFTDHYEPLWNHASEDLAIERVARWSARWPVIAGKFRDSAGRAPRYTFFYPEEEYRPHLLEPLAKMTAAGIGDVEIHIHHDGEGQQNFVDRISSFKDILRSRHGLLRRHNGR